MAMNSKSAMFFACAFSVAIAAMSTPGLAAKTKPGSTLAIGDVCADMIGRTQQVLSRIERGEPEEILYDNVNMSIDVAYRTIGKLLKSTKKSSDPIVGGDAPLGFARLTGVAVGAIGGTFSVETELSPIKVVIKEIFIACKRTMRRGEAVLPKGYPYSGLF